MTKKTDALQHFLLEEIPLARAMAIEVRSYDGHELHLAAPLAPNVNHRNTAFGGSIATLGIVAGWGLLHMKLQESDGDYGLVIQKSEIEYLAPVHGDFEAHCAVPGEEEWAAFTRRLKKQQRARVKLIAEVFCGNDLVARQTGSYAAFTE